MKNPSKQLQQWGLSTFPLQPVGSPFPSNATARGSTAVDTNATDLWFDPYVYEDQELVTWCAVCVEPMQSEVGSGSYVEERQDDDEAEPEPLPSYSEALNVVESMKVFLYAHNIPNETKQTS